MPKKVRIDLNKDELIRLRDEGKTNKEIAEYFDTTLKVVTNNINRYGLQRGNKKTVDPELLKQYLDDGLPILEIAKRFGIGKDLVMKHMRENNLHRSKEQININRKNTILKMCDGDLSKYYDPIVKKQYKTWQDKTGLENPYNDPDMKEKRKQSCLDKYGCENPMQSDVVKDKTKKTNMERYGCVAPSQNKDVIAKMQKNYLEKTGYKNPSQNPDIQIKKVKTFEERYGVPNSSQQNFSEKAKSVLLNKETLYEYLTSGNVTSIEGIMRDLFVSKSTIWKTIRRFNLGEFVPKFASRGEEELRSFVLSLCPNAYKANNLLGDKREIDVYCPDQKVGFEYNGTYYHSDIFISSRLYHYNKSKACEERGIRLIHIYEDEWVDPVKQEIIKSLIKISLGKVDSRIYARECEVREITNKEARVFNDANHIQGHRNAKITYGLFHNDELVQLMSFSWNSHYKAWEIIRGCPGSNNIVVGGVSKLFKHFIKEHNPDKIFSYCDYNKFNGVGYKAIGMEFIGETKCNKWYVINGKRYERNPKKYKLYKENSECVIWGAGSKKYMWYNPDTNIIIQN